MFRCAQQKLCIQKRKNDLQFETEGLECMAAPCAVILVFTVWIHIRIGIPANNKLNTDTTLPSPAI